MFILAMTAVACQPQNTATAPPPPPPEIPVFVTKTQQVPIYQEFVGQVHGAKDIAIRARLEGFLEGMHFQEGSEINEGALLSTLESQPFEAKVAAEMSRVAEAKTMLAKATNDLGRIKPLAKRKAVSQSTLDGAVAQYEAARASLEAAQANLKAANIQLSYTKIYSPINGIIGRTQAKVGDFVGREPNPVILNVISNIDTVLVNFFLTETQYLFMARRYLAESDNADPSGSRQETDPPEIELILADDSLYPHKGKFDFIDREVDPTTGAILLQTSFPNPTKLIRPGQFAKVKIKVEQVKDAILVPQRCVSEAQGRYTVYIVTANNQVEQRDVAVGPTIDNFWLIKKGLQPGEKVVYEGLQRIANTQTVKPVVTAVERIQMDGKTD